MKKGAPTIAVIEPIGNSLGAIIVREIISAKSIKIIPPKIE